MTHRLTIIWTYKVPPGHNRLTDVTLAVVATLTTDGTVTIEFDDPNVDSMTTNIIASNLRDGLSPETLRTHGLRLLVTVLSPTPEWIVPIAAGRAAPDAARQLKNTRSALSAS